MIKRFSSFILAAPLAMTLLAGCDSGKPMDEAITNTTKTADTTAATDTKTVNDTTASAETTAPPIVDDGLIKDSYTGVFTKEGNWQWSSLTSPMKIYPETLWVTGASGAWAKYEPKITAVGKVRISAHILGWDENQDKNVEITVSTSSGMTKINVNTAEYKKGQSDWLELGTFDFDGSGTEFVQITRVSDSKNTRASTIRFEILNSAGDGTVWQYIYLGPSRDSLYTDGLVELDRFTDLDDCAAAYDIEYLGAIGIISEEGEFRPEEAAASEDFAAWLSAASGQAISASGILTAESAAKLLHDAAIASGKNFEWLGDYTDASDFVVESGITKKMPAGTLTRAQAASLIKGYCHAIRTAGVPADSWTLTFHDEFEGDKLDMTTWVSDSSSPGHILSSRWPSNLEVKDGVLRLLTKKEKIKGYEDKDWTTGNVWVNKNVFSQKGGWWEASIRINAAGGLNNAFWMINAGKEIDIVEAHYMNVINTNLHINENGQNKQYSNRWTSDFDLSADFHNYALHWTDTELIYYFDGEEIARKVNYGSDTEMWPYFSTAVLNWAGKINDEADGKAMEVEWVRIYQEK